MRYDIPTYSVKNSDTTDSYGQIITVGGVGVVGGDFSHTLYRGLGLSLVLHRCFVLYNLYWCNGNG